MNTTSWNGYHNGGDDTYRSNRLRAATAPSTAPFPMHPTALMPGQLPQPVGRSNFQFTDASRRMSIANDIRNAHNIPLVPPPPIPRYPPQIAPEFQPRPPPPVPASTPPPPRPPLPPSLTTSVLPRPSVTTSPPPLPPKPFTAPIQLQAGPRPQLSVSTVPRALLPGGQPTIPQNDDSDIAMAMALSASVSNEEQALRQKLATQEEEDIAKALEASLLDTRVSDRPRTFAYAAQSSNQASQSVPNGQSDNNIYEETFARSLASSSNSGAPGSLAGPSHSSTSAISQSDSTDEGAISDIKQKSQTSTYFGTSSKSSPTDPELPGYSLKDGQSDTLITPATQDHSSPKLKIALDNSTSSTPHTEERLGSPSTPSDLAYLRHGEEQGEMTPRAEKASLARHLNSYSGSSTNYPWQPPNPDLTRNLSVPSPSVASNTAPELHEALKTAPSDIAHSRLLEAENKPTPGNSSDLPKYSPRSISPAETLSGPSSSSHKTNQPSFSKPNVSSQESSGAPVADHSKASYSDVVPPSYTETPSDPAGESSRPHTSQAAGSSSSIWNTAPSSTRASSSRPSSSASASSSVHSHFTSPVEAGGRLSRVSSAHSSNDDHDDNLDSARPAASSVNINAFVNRELFNGVSVGFQAPKITPQLIPMAEDMPPIISLPYGKARPLHLLGPSWRHLLKLMAGLSGTRMEPALDAVAVTKTAPKLRTVIQFVKPHRDFPAWRTIFYFTIDYPPPQPQIRHRSVVDLPFSYSLAGVPTLLRESSDSALSKTYTIPATTSVPFPTLPITFPNLAMYLQAALDESRRYLNDSHSDYRKLAKMITMCYPDEDVPQEPSERRGLFQRVMGRSNKAPRRGGNEDTYELVTPFVPDEWG